MKRQKVLLWAYAAASIALSGAMYAFTEVLSVLAPVVVAVLAMQATSFLGDERRGPRAEVLLSLIALFSVLATAPALFSVADIVGDGIGVKTAREFTRAAFCALSLLFAALFAPRARWGSLKQQRTPR